LEACLTETEKVIGGDATGRRETESLFPSALYSQHLGRRAIKIIWVGMLGRFESVSIKSNCLGAKRDMLFTEPRSSRWARQTPLDY